MSADSPRHGRAGGPLTVASQPPSDRTLIDTVSGFISDVTLASQPSADVRDTIQWARFETADINEPTPEGERENELSPLLLVLGYGSGVQVWLIPPNGEGQEVMSWRQGTVRTLRILPTPARGDSFACKRPLFALCDSASPGPLYCSLSFISLRGGDQVKSIKFKNPIVDVLANKRSVVVSFPERFAVFDAGTLEDRLAVTTCYPCPCPLGGANPLNPLALGDRWLAYADKKLNPAKRSSGGCEGDGVPSYTATVLHAAKSLSKGLRGLSESVAHSLAGGGRGTSQSPSPPHAERRQRGIVTILDIESLGDEECSEAEASDGVVAHFVAHSDAIIALRFDPSGLLLVTADKRGHDFHVFRVHPHPCGAALAAVHHLYVLHRGDTTAKVQDIAISSDSRWTAISTLRGTTHVFPISPYGGPCGVRTHTTPRVVNRLSRFQRSAGLPIQPANARSSSPVADLVGQGSWFPNPRLPPYPPPTTVLPLEQLRPTTTAAGIPTHTITRNSSGRQRLSSLSEEGTGVPLLACARWGAAPPAPPAPPASPHPAPRPPAAHALYLITATGHLLHYLMHPRPSSSVAKEKVCDESPVELGVELVAQWPLCRPPAAPDLAAPLPQNNPLLQRPHFKNVHDASVSDEERWLAQVEIVTHAGPHRRLWMGPQFVFKTYNSTLSGSSSSLLEAEAVEVESVGGGAARSPPVNMPGARPLVPVLIDSGSASSLEHSPSDGFRRKSQLVEGGVKPVAALGDLQLREDLAEAMRETEQGARAETARRVASVSRAVDPLGTVVVPTHDARQEPLEHPDSYTRPNDDEALFRPVVRAPAPLPAHTPTVSALPLDTRIPVQSVAHRQLAHHHDPAPLNSDVVIPAALTAPLSSADLARSLASTDGVESKETHPSSTSDFCEKSNLVECAHGDGAPTSECITVIEVFSDKTDVQSDSRRSPLDKLPEIIISESVNLTPKVRYKEASDAEDIQKIADASDEIAEIVNTEKVSKVVKNSSKSKTRERRSMTPREVPVVNKSDESCSNLEKVPKVKEASNFEASVWNPKPSVRKTNKKSAKIVDVLKQTKTEKQENIDKEPAMITVILPSSKDDSSRDETIDVVDKVKVGECGRVDVPPLNHSEDQIWAMLSDNLGDTKSTTSSQLVELKKNDESKSKSNKKNKKNKKIEQQKEEKEFVLDPLTKIKWDNAESSHSFAVVKQNEDEFDIINAKKENSDSCYVTNENISHEENVSKQSSTFDMSHFEFATEQFKKFTLEEDVERSSSKLGETVEIREDSLAGFDLPIDFDVYLTEKSKHEKTIEVVKTSSAKEDALQELFVSSKLQSNNKSKKHSKSERANPVKCEQKTGEEDGKHTTVGKNWKDDSDIVLMDSLIGDFPALGDKRWSAPSFRAPVPVKSYSSAISSKARLEEAFGPELGDILEPPKPCRVTLHDKLAELCKRRDIAVAECDKPESFDEPSSESDLPPVEFSLDEINIEVMRDSTLETDPFAEPFNDEEVKADKAGAKRSEGERLEKSSDDDNASPITSQTDSDEREDKKPPPASDTAVPTTKSNNKKKSKQKRRK